MVDVVTDELLSTRGSHHRCSATEVFLEISQNSQENTYARDSFLIKLQALALQLGLQLY